ncbi:hypothetical protein AX14_008081 [Amanita brunnescens Koide BX004]|nr:hypothetical protein AX14_008081 [Amanita brunnescens Koide BX004]
MENIRTMAYAQWVVINIVNSSARPVVIKNVRIHWGKFYKEGDKNIEVSVHAIENTRILPGQEFRISSCGRENATSGTEGEFDIFEDGSDKIRHFYWDCPWGKKGNTWRVSESNRKWVVDTWGANIDSGALGNITVDLFKKH